jgi:peroxiredoxin
VKVIAVSTDPKEESAKMKSELGLPFPLLSDEDEQVIKRYGLVHEKGKGNEDIPRPADLLLDPQGVIRWAMFTDNIRVSARPEALLEAAKKLR